MPFTSSPPPNRAKVDLNALQPGMAGEERLTQGPAGLESATFGIAYGGLTYSNKGRAGDQAEREKDQQPMNQGSRESIG